MGVGSVGLAYFCQMEVTDALVDHLARLSRLRFTESEKQEIRQDLQRMIGFVEKLNEVDTGGLEPVLHMSTEVNRLRKDVIEGSITTEAALQNAAESHPPFFTVPKVIKK
jgi:aspartyl-tRNA(Asn)/glutamyl-tRNA(Gln) amidotransferase subunit C